MRIIGDFWTDLKGDISFGEVVLADEKTRITITGTDVASFKDSSVIYGKTYEFKKITCLDCVPEFWTGPAMHSDKIRRIDLFPHHVLTGKIFFDEKIELISEVIFEFTEGQDFFKDRRKFGTLGVLDDELKEVLTKVVGRGRDFQSDGVLFYFSGNKTVLSISTAIGEVTVRDKFLDRASDVVEHKVEVTIKFEMPVHFRKAFENLLTIRTFFTLFAGRPQGVTDVRLVIPPRDVSLQSEVLQLSSSYAPAAGKQSDANGFRRFALPMHIAEEPNAFADIMRNWLERHYKWATARSYFIQCVEEENFYDASRLVRVANLFELIPNDDIPELPELAASAVQILDEISKLAQKLPKGLERSVLLSAVGTARNRKHKKDMKLRQRVQARSQIVLAHIGHHISDIEIVIEAAIEFRNYFVHGNSKLKFEHISPYLDFMTDALEFIFAFSDLVEAGWAGERWMNAGALSHHKFGRYLRRHAKEIGDFKVAWESASEQR